MSSTISREISWNLGGQWRVERTYTILRNPGPVKRRRAEGSNHKEPSEVKSLAPQILIPLIHKPLNFDRTKIGREEKYIFFLIVTKILKRIKVFLIHLNAKFEIQ